MSPAQRTQIQARLAAVAAERAAQADALATTKPVTDARSRSAKKQAAYRQRKGKVGKAADAARKRTSRAKKA